LPRFALTLLDPSDIRIPIWKWIRSKGCGASGLGAGVSPPAFPSAASSVHGPISAAAHNRNESSNPSVLSAHRSVNLTGGQRLELPGKLSKLVAVGTRVTPRPPHRSVHEALPHTVPASGGDAKMLARKRVTDSHRGNPPGNQAAHPLPAQLVFLAATP
jgi:hypothetical protein